MPEEPKPIPIKRRGMGQHVPESASLGPLDKLHLSDAQFLLLRFKPKPTASGIALTLEEEFTWATAYYERRHCLVYPRTIMGQQVLYIAIKKSQAIFDAARRAPSLRQFTVMRKDRMPPETINDDLPNLLIGQSRGDIFEKSSGVLGNSSGRENPLVHES